VQNSIVDEIVDMAYDEVECKVLSQPCSWCCNPSTTWLMHQPFCEECANKVRELHGNMCDDNEYHPER
jgi:hypothetical protein